MGVSRDELEQIKSYLLGFISGGIDLVRDYIWSGNHTFQATLTTHDIVPEASDTYRLGTFSLRWLQLFVSEIKSAIFTRDQIFLVDGVIRIGKGAGIFPADIAAADTQINFGRSITINDFIEVRSEDLGGTLAVEYMKVLSLVSGTTYNVTRNLDGSGANDWKKGTPFSINGQSGDGRVDLVSSAADPTGGPRISIGLQGTLYSDFTERVRIGNMNGSFGIASALYGVGIGDYSGGNYFRYDPTNGLRLRFGGSGANLSGEGLSFRQDEGFHQRRSITWVNDLDSPTTVYSKIFSAYYWLGPQRVDYLQFLLQNSAGTYYTGIILQQGAATGLETKATIQSAAFQTQVDTPLVHYASYTPNLSAPHPIAVWKEGGYIGASATKEVIDMSGQGRHMSINGTVSFNQTAIGDSPSVPYIEIANGTNYLERADEAAFDNARGYFTAMGWFYFSLIDGTSQAVWGQNNSAFTTVTQWGVYVYSTNKLQFHCPNAGAISYAEHPTALSASAWYFVAGRFTSATEIALFVNGTKTVNTASIATNLNNSTYALRVFRNGDGTHQMKGGRAALLSLHAAALSNETIAAVYNSQRDYFGV